MKLQIHYYYYYYYYYYYFANIIFVTNQHQLQTKSKFLFGHAFERDEYFEAQQ
jgi:hypothetical protein